MSVKIRMGTRRKAFVAPVSETPACADFDVVGHFRKIRNGSPRSGYPYEIGEDVAALLADDKSAKIVYGRLYASDMHPQYGVSYRVVTREGDKYRNVSPSLLAHI